MSTSSYETEESEYNMGLNDYAIPLAAQRSTTTPSTTANAELSSYAAVESSAASSSAASSSAISQPEEVWTRYEDETSGFAYFVNESTGESRWEVAEEVLTATEDTIADSTADTEEQGWIEVTDGDGNKYYYNEVSALNSLFSV